VSDSYLHDFWEASALNNLTIHAFASKVLAYESDDQDFVPDNLVGSAARYPLYGKSDRLQRTMERRRSGRSFSDAPLSEKDLGRILASVTGPATQRTYPSAGGLASVEVFALLERVNTSLGRVACRYLSAEHELEPLGVDLPDASALDELLSLEGNKPALVLVFAVRLDELVQKYGARGGRFALIEVGHACQNIGLRLEALGLVGYQLGGTLDHDLEYLLKLDHEGRTRANVTLGYAIGHPA